MGDGFQLPVQPQYVYIFHFMSTIDVVKLYCNALGVNYNITFFLLCWPFWKIKSKRDRKKPQSHSLKFYVHVIVTICAHIVVVIY